MTPANFMEAAMLCCFIVAWSIHLSKLIRTKTAKGRSRLFSCLFLLGCLCGLGAKILASTYDLAFWFYFPTIAVILIDIVIYYRNKQKDEDNWA